MTSQLANLDLDLADYDLWAIRCVVREGRWMNLNREEQIIAVHLLRRKGLSNHQIAARMRIGEDLATKMALRCVPKIDIDTIPERVMGAPVDNSYLSRSDVRGRC